MTTQIVTLLRFFLIESSQIFHVFVHFGIIQLFADAQNFHKNGFEAFPICTHVCLLLYRLPSKEVISCFDFSRACSNSSINGIYSTSIVLVKMWTSLTIWLKLVLQSWVLVTYNSLAPLPSFILVATFCGIWQRSVRYGLWATGYVWE